MRQVFIIRQINRLYCAQSHFYERISELIDQTDFSDLQIQIIASVNDMAIQIEKSNDLYAVLKSEYSFEYCSTMLQLLEEDFNLIYENRNNLVLRNITLLNYVQNIQNIVTTTFQFLILNDRYIGGQVKKYVNDNCNSMLKGKLFEPLIINMISTD